MIIDILDWIITYDELLQWVTDNDIVLDAINGYGNHGLSTRYIFQNEEDFIAFKLKFTQRGNRFIMGYNGTSATDIGYFYAPYIPVNNEKNPD